MRLLTALENVADLNPPLDQPSRDDPGPDLPLGEPDPEPPPDLPLAEPDSPEGHPGTRLAFTRLPGGLLTGPSPVDRARRGSKHHLLVLFANVSRSGISWAMQRPDGNTRGWPRPPSDLAALPPGVPVCRGGTAYPRRPAPPTRGRPSDRRHREHPPSAANHPQHSRLRIISDLVNVHPPEQPG